MSARFRMVNMTALLALVGSGLVGGSTVAVAGPVGVPAQASGVQASGEGGLPDFDRRLAKAVAPRARADLRALGDVEVGWSKLGTPHSLRSRTGTLTGPSDAAPDAVARGFLREHAGLFRQGDTAALRLTMQDRDRSGVTFLRYRQTHVGRDVHGSSLLVVLDGQRRIVLVGGTLAPDLGPADPPGITAEHAVSRAALTVNPGKAAGAPRQLRTDKSSVTFGNTVAVPDLRDAAPVRADLVTVPSADGGRTAWRVRAEVASNADYETLVDAATGEVIYRRNQVTSSEPHGLVHTADDPDSGDQVANVPFTGLDGSWVDGETTAGNNTNTYQDLFDDDGPDAADQPDTDPAPNQHFDYTWTDPWGTSATLPTTGPDRDAVVTQLFYYTNWYHDYAYQLGFTETARNFQNDNFGRGGDDGDAVRAEADDSYGDGTTELCQNSNGDPIRCRNNANFHAGGSDGSTPRMQMYVGEQNLSGGGVRRTQRAMNRDTVIHEYSHGISGRIISDGNLDGDVQSGALGEGWSDAFATSINDDPVYGEYNNGNNNTGIRSVRYDGDNKEYGDLCNNGAPNPCQVHDDGEIWAMAMWEQRTALIAKHGLAVGKAMHETLLMLGLKNTPDTPSFHDARTGYLVADQLNPGPDNQCLIWRVFADNELGVTAGPDSDDDQTPTVSTATPASCAPAAVALDPPVVAEGTAVQLSSAGSAVGGDPGDSLSYAWDLDNDGQYDDSTLANPSVTFGDNGSYQVGLRVVNTAGYVDTDTATVTVTNVAPSVVIDPDQLTTALENGALTVRGTFADPGWLDTYSGSLDPGTPYLSAVSGTVSVTSQGPPTDSGTVQASITYGDNGGFTVTVRVADDDGGVGSDTVGVTIGNVAPSATIDETGAVLINGVPTIFADAGQSIPLAARVTDPGSDDVTTRWDWGDGNLSAPVVNRVDPPGNDPASSPSVELRDFVASDNHAWAKACMYTVGFAAVDDDGGAAADQARVLITGTPKKSQGSGYWKHQFDGILLPKDFTNAQLDCYLTITGHLSKVFNEARDASTRAKAGDVLFPGLLTSTPRKRLDTQVLTAWLNFANGGVEYNEPVVDSDDNGSPDLDFATVMATAETLRLNPASSGHQLDKQSHILSCINERDYLLPPLLCSLLN